MSKPFWETKSLSELSASEWEQLCDGCGKCCLHKLEDEETGELFFTRVACHLLNDKTCRCEDYENRQARVPECLVVTMEDESVFEWLPSTCAYRLRYQGEPLPAWHPLICGNKNTVHEQPDSIPGHVISETFVHPEDFEEHIIQWVN